LRQQRNEKAVSPVIGVILMVAITVVLAATIGTFVLGLGDQVNENARASINVDVKQPDGSMEVSLVTLSNSDYVLIRGAEGLELYDSPGYPDNKTVGGTEGDKVFINTTGTRVRLVGSGSGTVTAVAVIGDTPEDGIKNGELTDEEPRGDPEQGLVETTTRRVEYDFS
jgi:flagellin-like protein